MSKRKHRQSAGKGELRSSGTVPVSILGRICNILNVMVPARGPHHRQEDSCFSSYLGPIWETARHDATISGKLETLKPFELWISATAQEEDSTEEKNYLLGNASPGDRRR